VFTVGPSSVPPPPCDALDLAQSTGKYPPWPSKAFATSSWAQVYALLKGGPVTPDGGPTASVAAVPAGAARRPGPPAGWVVIILLILAIAAAVILSARNRRRR
jgi:hypothetical protein